MRCHNSFPFDSCSSVCRIASTWLGIHSMHAGPLGPNGESDQVEDFADGWPGNSFVIRSERYQPTILRENKSMMEAKYNQPSFVQIYVISATHTWFGSSASNCWFNKFGYTGQWCFEFVVALYFFFVFERISPSFMILATVLNPLLLKDFLWFLGCHTFLLTRCESFWFAFSALLVSVCVDFLGVWPMHNIHCLKHLGLRTSSPHETSFYAYEGIHKLLLVFGEDAHGLF